MDYLSLHMVGLTSEGSGSSRSKVPRLTKTGCMFLGVMAPEILLRWAMDSFVNTRHLHSQMRTRPGLKQWTMTHCRLAVLRGFKIREEDGSTINLNLKLLKNSMGMGVAIDPGISEEELKSRSHGDWATKLIAITQAISFLAQTITRVVQRHHVTAIEISTVAFIACSTITYLFPWSTPHNVEYPVFIERRNITPISAEGQPMPDVWKENKFDTFYNSVRVDSALFFLCTCGFGALHCLAWNAPFPTSAERLAWQIASILVTALPIIAIPTVHWPEENLVYKLTWLPSIISYVILRLMLVTLSLTALRAMPADTFQTVNWSSYFSHIGT